MTTQGDFRCLSCDTDDFVPGDIYHGEPFHDIKQLVRMPTTMTLRDENGKEQILDAEAIRQLVPAPTATMLRDENGMDHMLNTKEMCMWVGSKSKNRKAVFELVSH